MRVVESIDVSIYQTVSPCHPDAVRLLAAGCVVATPMFEQVRAFSHRLTRDLPELADFVSVGMVETGDGRPPWYGFQIAGARG